MSTQLTRSNDAFNWISEIKIQQLFASTTCVSCNVHRKASNEETNRNKTNDINSSHIQHILNFYITKRWLPIVSLDLKLIRHHASCCFSFRSRIDRMNCMPHDANTNRFKSKISRQANQQNENCLLALCWIPCLKTFSLKMKHSLGSCNTFWLSSMHAQKVANILVCRHFSNSISGLYNSGGISIYDKKFRVILNTIIKFIICWS